MSILEAVLLWVVLSGVSFIVLHLAERISKLEKKPLCQKCKIIHEGKIFPRVGHAIWNKDAITDPDYKKFVHKSIEQHYWVTYECSLKKLEYNNPLNEYWRLLMNYSGSMISMYRGFAWDGYYIVQPEDVKNEKELYEFFENKK